MAFLPPIGVGGPSVARTSQTAEAEPQATPAAAPAEPAPAVNRGWVPGAKKAAPAAAPAASAGTGQASGSKDNDWIIKAGDSEEVKKEKRKKMAVKNMLDFMKGQLEKQVEEQKKAMNNKG